MAARMQAGNAPGPPAHRTAGRQAIFRFNPRRPVAVLPSVGANRPEQPTGEYEDSTLRKFTWQTPLIALLLSSCSAVGWELQNYSFYGAVPEGNGRDLERMSVSEWTYTIADGDTLSSHEGDLQIDTTRVRGNRLWVMTRSTVDSLGRPVLDSVWLDHYTLRTRRSWHRAGDGEITRLQFNRRVVDVDRIDADGNHHDYNIMHTAEPFGRVGVGLVLATIKWELGQTGSLPVVWGDGRTLHWLHYKVVDRTTAPRQVAGGMMFDNIWVISTKLDGTVSDYWVNAVTHQVVRHTTPRSDGSKLVIAMGRPIIKLIGLAVEPLPTRAGRGTRVLRNSTIPPDAPNPASSSRGIGGRSGP